MLAALTPILPLSYKLFHNQIGKKNVLLNCSGIQYLNIPRHSTNQRHHVSPTLNLHPWFHKKTNKIC